MPSDAESREEQDGSKQYFVGQTTTKLQAVFHIHVAKNTERNENQRFLTLLKKATFPASFDN